MWCRQGSWALHALPHQVAYRRTDLEVSGLIPATEYTLMVLPRNGKGWGARWSDPLRATTGPSVLPPLKVAPPAVRMAEGCRAAFVRIPAASTGCRAADEFLLQVHLLGDDDGSWSTLQHAEPGSVAEISGFGHKSAFAVRLVAQNAHGAAAPSESTAVTPGPLGECNSERTWSPGAASLSIGHGPRAPAGGQRGQASPWRALRDRRSSPP